jgi:hypothetical protein
MTGAATASAMAKIRGSTILIEGPPVDYLSFVEGRRMVTNLHVQRQKADKPDEPEQTNQVPDQIALAASGEGTILGFCGDSAAVDLSRGCGPACRGHQEQREYQTPVHWHPPSLRQKSLQQRCGAFKANARID